MTSSASRLSEILGRSQGEILTQWVKMQLSAMTRRADLLREDELRDQSRQFLAAVIGALRAGNDNVDGSEWAEVRDLLSSISASRARQGFSPAETALFVFSLKEPVFSRLRQEHAKEHAKEADALAADTWTTSVLLDTLGLVTVDMYQKTREEVIRRQQEELIELSTPVVKLWEGILAVPLIGTLDSARTQVVMESLLQQIVDTGSAIAIIDITGVPTVDTLVAQHLLKTVAAARLMGADCIISGVRPQIAQTIVHLGVNLGDVITKPSLAHALAVAFKRTGVAVSKTVAS
jgi:rsbT co-antagonist protein RsbR